MFRNTLQSLKNNNFNNVSLLINDLNIKRDSYKYGYNTNYYTDDRSSGFCHVFSKRRNNLSRSTIKIRNQLIPDFLYILDYL